MGQSSIMPIKLISKNTKHSGELFRTIGPLIYISTQKKKKKDCWHSLEPPRQVNTIYVLSRNKKK